MAELLSAVVLGGRGRNRDQVQISVDDGGWRKICFERLERLKAKELDNSESDPATPMLQQEQEHFKNEMSSAASELRMAVRNGNVYEFVDVLEKLCCEKKLALSFILNELMITPVGNSVLHEASYFGNPGIALLIVHFFPVLLTKTNIKGDTPLHVAARSQTGSESLDVIKVLLFENEEQELGDQGMKITRLTNTYGNTPLHEAVLCYNTIPVGLLFETVILLFEADKFVAHYLNKSGQSPLYLAALTPITRLVEILLEVPFPDESPKRHGNSPLHAAIYTRNAEMIEMIVSINPRTLYIKDEDGGTALHYAASIGYVEGVRILCHTFGQTAMQWNTEGDLPIHLACKEGQLEVVAEFLKQELGGDDSIWVNMKGQNILHVAAQNGQVPLVNYLLKNSKLNINDKDNDGNTPLHLAAKHLLPDVLLSLTKDKNRSIHVDILNNDDLTARDVLELQLRTKASTFIQWLSVAVLSSVGAGSSGRARRIVEKERVGSIVANEEWVKSRTDTLMLVTVLIATVTFAAGFTVPGGLYASDDKSNKGKAIFVERRMFQIYMVCNTIALYSSTFGTFILLWAQLGDYRLAQTVFGFVFNLVAVGLLTMTLAFLAAGRLVVCNLSWFANLITVIGFVFLSVILFFYVLAVFPLAIRMPVLRQVSHLIIRIYTAISPPKPKPI